MANEQSSSLQWLETYVIRYTTGTILGSIIVYILCKKYENLTPLLFGLDINKIENPHIFLLLLAYGLCFCYIASGPVLILHAGRFYPRLIENFSRKNKILNSSILFGVPTVLSLGYLLITSYHSFSILFFFELTLATLLLWGQYFVVAHIFIYKNDFYNFYKKLSMIRKKQENKELVESYRKLKDHGNAFMILFCEVALGFLLYCANIFDEISTSVNFIILLLWIVPAAAIWIGATSIESCLVYNEE
jgi:hypothetical protein